MEYLVLGALALGVILLGSHVARVPAPGIPLGPPGYTPSPGGATAQLQQQLATAGIQAGAGLLLDVGQGIQSAIAGSGQDAAPPDSSQTWDSSTVAVGTGDSIDTSTFTGDNGIVVGVE